MISKKNSKQRGATMVEYALIVAAIAVVAYVGAQALGNSVSSKFEALANSVQS